MPKKLFALLFATAAFPTFAQGLEGKSSHLVIPIFSQLISFNLPPGFVSGYTKETPAGYIQEFVPEGESVQNWTQIVTVTGTKGLSAKPEVTPKGIASTISAGFKRVCPNSFMALYLGELKVSENEAIVGHISCGTATSVGAGNSESLLLVVIKGKFDYYTIQWAEKGPMSSTPLKLDDKKWHARFKSLQPLKVCNMEVGEAAPDPSCKD